MEKGWDATGRLEALWGHVGGRDKLAALTGIQPGTLSGYNTGRLPLGMRNAVRIADALEVSVLDLGAPEEMADERGKTLQSLLEELVGDVAGLTNRQAGFRRELDVVLTRLERLEARPARVVGATKRRKG